MDLANIMYASIGGKGHATLNRAATYRLIWRLGPMRVHFDRYRGWMLDNKPITIQRLAYQFNLNSPKDFDAERDLLTGGGNHEKTNGNREKLHLGKGV